MGTIFDVVGCECKKDSNKKLKRYNTVNNINPVRVSDYSSSEMIFSQLFQEKYIKISLNIHFL